MRKKYFSVMLIIMTGIILGGCGGKKETHLEITKDGNIESSIIETFDKSYYDQDELQQMILEEAASYNRMAGKGAISVHKIDVNSGVATVNLTYESATDYATFNDETFFCGTPEQAVSEGYDLNVVLSSVSDEFETIGMGDMLAMKGVSILITDVSEPVVLNGKAKYISGNVILDKKFKTISLENASEELAYIIYK